MIVGIDEVGRGAWAGPVVVASAVVNDGIVLEGLNDSKLLTKKRRDQLAPVIRHQARWLGIGWVSAKLIDDIGMSAALKLAARRSVVGLPADFDEFIIDGTIRLLERPGVTTLKKADQLIPSVMAASVIAKVARDTYMEKLAQSFPAYGFERHVGYGTAYHQQQLELFGSSAVHRLSFAPMKSMGSYTTDMPPTIRPSANTGAIAETKAADWLVSQGYELIVRNWKTKLCEIDIIAEREGIVYFVEVKYREHSAAGRGLEYITAKKQQQMAFAANAWRHLNNWSGEVRLVGLELSGKDYAITNFVSDIRVD